MHIKAGSIVRVKSGGPEMTVERVADDYAYCVWFKGMKQKKADFTLDSLEHCGD